MRNKQISIQLKAAFLLLVFALNTLVGFACSVGIDMGFNSSHHSHAAVTPVVHVHSDGKQHNHAVKNAGHNVKAQKHELEKNVKHHHNDKQLADEENTGTNDKDNCCNDEVIKFEQIDKAVAKVFAYQAPLFVLCFFSYSYIDLLYSSEAAPRIRYFVRSYHPPIPDIRIAVQSFQI